MSKKSLQSGGDSISCPLLSEVGVELDEGREWDE